MDPLPYQSIDLNLSPTAVLTSLLDPKRRNRPLTMRGLARKLDVSHAYLSRVASGKTSPSAQLIETLGKYLKLDASIVELWKQEPAAPRLRSSMPDLNAADPLVPVEVRLLRTDFSMAGTLLRLTHHPLAAFGRTSPVISDMNECWKMAGLPERGYNTWLYAEQERDDPLSPYYQSMLGVFTVRNFAFSEEWKALRELPHQSAQRFAELGNSAQDAWLYEGGYQGTPSTIVPDTFQLTPWTQGWYRHEYRLQTHSHFGTTMPAFKPSMEASAPLPPVDPMHPMILQAAGLFKYLPKQDLFVGIYRILAEYTLRDGTIRTPSPRLKFEMDSLMDQLIF